MDDSALNLILRNGHFLMESGLHGDLWLDLDILFCDPAQIAPLVQSLSTALDKAQFDAVCGSLDGGAFLAQAIAAASGRTFFYTRRQSANGTVRYVLPDSQRERVGGRRFAVVDDAINAGSAARGTVAALTEAGATVAVVGALLTLTDVAVKHFVTHGIPYATLFTIDSHLYAPGACPLCAAGMALEVR